jgi:type II secretory pathway component PulF
VETHKSGGQIATILVSVAQSLQELEKIKKERSASVYSQMINGYLIYVVFLGVMIGLSTVLIPAFKLGETLPDLNKAFIEMFRALTVIQGAFAGLAIGKMAEGTLTAGIKHAMVLVIFGYSVFMIFV